jgi:hypothetical protein
VNSSSLRIHRLSTHAAVPSGAPLAATRSRLDAALIDRFADALGEVMPAERDEGLWLIRRLRVRATVASHWTASEIARQIAKQCVFELTKTLDARPDADEVLWFPSQSAYLAHFLADCAEGRAFGRWQYARFERFAGLSTSAALREVLVAEPELSRGAIAELLPREPDLLIRQLTPHGAELVLNVLADSEGEGPSSVVKALGELVEAGRMPSDRRSMALALYVETARGAGAGALEFIYDVAKAATLFLRARHGDREALARWLAGGDLASIGRRFGGDTVADLVGLTSWSDDDRRRLAATLAGSLNTPVDSEPSEAIDTRFGGVFLLLQLLGEFTWDATALPDLDGVPASHVLQYLTVVAAIGRPRNLVVFRDPALRLACGMPAHFELSDLSSWTAQIKPKHLRMFHDAWLAGLKRSGFLSGRTLVSELKRNRLEIDTARGMWSHIFPLPAQQGGGRRVREANTDEGSEIPQTANREQQSSFLRHGESDAKDFDYASLNPASSLPAPMRRLLALTSQNLLRTFAWHLAGFARSSLPYLFTNFLDFRATVQPEEDRFVVQMDRPVLGLVLNVTTLAGKTFRLPATGDRPWVLTHRP